MKRILLLLSAAALLGSCEPTTYGQAIQQQKRAEATRAHGTPEAVPSCPTIASEGTTDYERCETLLESGETGVGGSGSAGQDPDVRYWRDADPVAGTPDPKP